MRAKNRINSGENAIRRVETAPAFVGLGSIRPWKAKIVLSRLLGNRQAELGQYLFHVFPNPPAVVRRVAPQQIRGVIGCHQLDRRMAYTGVVLVEYTA